MTRVLVRKKPVSNFDQLSGLCLSELKKKNLDNNQEYLDRLNHELKVIEKLNYVDYFLLVREIVWGARSIGVKVGPGRGSAAGSLVVYLLGITGIDPLKYNLLFERMLNESRASLPDVDLDFSDREKILEYVKNKFGKNKVVNVGVWSYYLTKSALQDSCRVLGVPFEDAILLNKRIPDDAESVDDAYRAPEVQTFIGEYGKQFNDTKVMHDVFEFAKILEGKIRHLGTHAAGIVITNNPTGSEIPLIKVEGTGDLVTSWTKDILDSLGYLKVDILGLSTLSVIQETITLSGKEIDIDSIGLDDPKVYEELGKGSTIGVFQLENPETVEILKAIKVTQFSDIYNITSVIRPGLDRGGFIDNHNHPSKVKYLLPELKDIFEETYGIMLFQEQVMEICRKCAGFSLVEADNIRKIIAKEKGAGIDKWKEKFINGCLNNKVSSDNANKIWDMIYASRSYSFNKSHACAYSVISYQTSWLKTYHPLQFLTACLNNDNDIKFINEAKRLSIKVLPPDVNKSKERYSIEGDSIRMGLDLIKHVGSSGKSVVENGPYSSVSDFLSKTKVRRNAFVSLVQAGCFDTLEDRGILLGKTMKAVEITESQSASSFGPIFDQIKDFKPVEKFELLKQEKEVIGFHISEDPLSRFKDKLRGTEFDNGINKKNVKLGGLITYIKVHKAASGNMAFIKLLSLRDEFECVIWPDIFKHHGNKIQVGYVVRGDGARTDRGNYSLSNFEILR